MILQELPRISVRRKPISVIIFDFDGTIADSFDVVLRITNRLATEFGYEPASPEEIKRLQNLSSRDILKQSKLPLFKLPFLLRRLKSEMGQEVSRLQPFEGIEAMLRKLKSHGYRLGILTSNTHANVITFLQQNQMADLFDFIRTEVNLFGKARRIHELVKDYQLDPETIVYVGDETRDIEAAKKIPIKVVAVSWGFNSKQALAEQQPDVLIHTPQDLIGAIAQL